MRLFRHARLLLLALVLSLVPAVSHAGVFISVGFAPPPMPVYVQPPCPDPGWMWTPGYWDYGPDGYYWVPGEWVPAPYVGALWTPGYWGWSTGLYVWHPGYWGRHIGYYGGVNYGFGYFGIGFVGGEWHGHDFAYNTAVVNVNRTVIHNVYVNRTVIDRYTVARDSHVAYSGGPGGIRHEPSPGELAAEHEQHMERTSFQTQHVDAAMHDHNAYARYNGGHPQNLVAQHSASEYRAEQQHAAPQQHYEQRAQPQQHYEQRAQPQQHFEEHAQPQQHVEPHAQPQYHPQEQYHAQPQQHYEQRAQPQQHYEQRAQPQQHYEQRAQPQREQHQESRPPQHDDHGGHR